MVRDGPHAASHRSHRVMPLPSWHLSAGSLRAEHAWLRSIRGAVASATGGASYPSDGVVRRWIGALEREKDSGPYSLRAPRVGWRWGLGGWLACHNSWPSKFRRAQLAADLPLKGQVGHVALAI